MGRFFPTAALTLALCATALSPSVGQNADQRAPTVGMMGGGCPMLGMMGQGMMGAGPSGQGMMAGRQAKMAALIDGRLAYLKGELNITDAQSEAWNGYANAVKGRVDIMQGMRQVMTDAMQKGSATARMDARIKSMEAVVESMKAVKPATEKLYAVLTNEQKKVADQLIGIDCGAMRRPTCSVNCRFTKRYSDSPPKRGICLTPSAFGPWQTRQETILDSGIPGS